jgi:hypothetical protein
MPALLAILGAQMTPAARKQVLHGVDLTGWLRAPTFSTVRASPSATQTWAAIRGSVRRGHAVGGSDRVVQGVLDVALPPCIGIAGT